MALDPQLPIPYSLTGPTGPTGSTGPAGPVRAVAPPRRNEATLAHQAGLILAESRAWVDPDERFRLAHLGALRTAAALFADRARPAVRRRPTNAWVLLAQVAPELADWATYFAAGASKRAAIEAGARQVVTAREADDLLRAATEFLTMVEVSLGIFSDARAS
jgi:hypothetical protein